MASKNSAAKVFRKKDFKKMDLLVLVSSLSIVLVSIIFFNGGSITGAAVFDLIGCGTLSSPGTYLLTQDVSSPGTCFTIGSHHIVLDCQGNTIRYSINGSRAQYGVYNVNFNNLTVQNCGLVNANTTSVESHIAIDARPTADSSFINNKISTLGAWGKGIVIVGPRNRIEENTIQARGTGASAITLITTHNISVRFNKVTETFGNGGHALSIGGSTRDAIIENNDFRSYDSAVVLGANVNRTVLLNNNLLTQLNNRNEIIDTATEAYINYLVYNNSFGEIHWTDNSESGFLRNLNINSPDPNGFGLGRGITIGPNLFYVDAAILGGQNGSMATSNVLITLKNLPFSGYVNEVRRTDTFETTSAAVLANGVDCLGTTCLYFCYNNNERKFKFTSFGLSGLTPQASFAVNQDTQRGPIYVQEDVDDNGVIDDSDIIPIVNHVLGANVLRDALFHTADVTCDDSLNIYDIESIVEAR